MGIKAGVVGVGRLGREHVRVLCALDGVEHVGCFDIDRTRARECAEKFGATPHDDLDELLRGVDAVCVVTPTTEHASVTARALQADCDVFVEKPISRTVDEAEEMISLAEKAGRVLQVGHVERFNGAVEAVTSDIDQPSFVEVHRLSPFTVRGTDVSVVGDLMIHDLDLLNVIVAEWPSEIRASGAAILTDGPDIVNARLEYPSGCVANVTASRVTAAPMRKVRVFSPSTYLSIDLLQGRATRYRKAAAFDARVAALRSRSEGHDRLNLSDFVEVETVQPDRVEPLVKELESFCQCVATRQQPRVTGRDGLNAVRLASEIIARIA